MTRVVSVIPVTGTPKMQIQHGRRHRWESEAGRPGARSGDASAVSIQMKVPSAANDNRATEVSRTRQVWEGRVGRNLSEGDAREIARNVAGFFKVLMEWSGAEERAAANDNVASEAVRKAEAGHDC